MSEPLELTLRLLATAGLIAINALYVFHEFAFVALKPGQVRRLDKEGSRASRLVSRMAHNLDHYIAVDQLGITASSLAVGWIGQPVVTQVFTSAFGTIGLSSGAWTVISAVVAFALLTGTQMIVGELMPKTYALRHAEGTARWVAGPVEWTARIFHPFVALLNGVGLGLVRLLGFEGRSDGHGQVMPAEELVSIVKASARAGALTADPDTLSRLLHFSDLEAHDLMVPRMDIVGVDMHASLDDVLATAQEHQHDRYPVFEGSRDRILGMVNVKDLLVAGVEHADRQEIDWRRWIAPIPTLPESAPVESLLATFNQAQQQMVLLVDEYGATEGIVTITDVTEQLIAGPDEIHPDKAQRLRIDGHASISIIESELGISLESEHRSSDTIAGLVLAELGRIPEPGDAVDIGGHRIEVVRMDANRIVEVSLERLPRPKPD